MPTHLLITPPGFDAKIFGSDKADTAKQQEYGVQLISTQLVREQLLSKLKVKRQTNETEL